MREHLPLLQRLYLGFLQLLLVLPFATITDCNTHKTVTYTGIGLFTAAEGGPALGIWYVLIIGLLLGFVLPASSGWDRQALWQPIRGFGCALAGYLCLIAPWFAGLFDDVEVHPPWYAMVSGWVIAYLGYLGVGVVSLQQLDDHPPVPEIAGAMGILAFAGLSSAVNAYRAGEGGDFLFCLLTPFVLALPVALTGLAVGWAHPHRVLRGLWWGVALLGCIAAVASTFD